MRKKTPYHPPLLPILNPQIFVIGNLLHYVYREGTNLITCSFKIKEEESVCMLQIETELESSLRQGEGSFITPLGPANFPHSQMFPV